MSVNAYKESVPNKRTFVGTPQTEPISESQVKNNAGGFVYQISDLKAVERFLILGTEKNTYYVSQKKYTADNVSNLTNAIKNHGKEVVDMIVSISDEGRASSNDPALFAFALATSVKFADKETITYAYTQFRKVIRIPTHLMTYMEFHRMFSSEGQGLKKAIQKWFLENKSLEYHAIKYQSRNGWSQRDLLRIAHPKTDDEKINAMFKFMLDSKQELKHPELKLMEMYQKLHFSDWTDNNKGLVQTAVEAVKMGFPREALPTTVHKELEVKKALILHGMPLTALIRNLSNFTQEPNVFTPNSDAIQVVVKSLTDEEYVKKSRIHPMQVISALRIYASGRNGRDATWVPNTHIIEALHKSFEISFKNAEPTNKRLYYAIDISGSMHTPMNNTGLFVSEAALLNAYISMKTEKSGNYVIKGFNKNLVELKLRPDHKDIVTHDTRWDAGETDCAKPIEDALKNNIPVDAFIIYTDNETWCGTGHVSEYLKQYREKMKIDAKLIVVGMTATRFSIADPNDPLCLDVVGFDTNTPNVISNFIRS